MCLSMPYESGGTGYYNTLMMFVMGDSTVYKISETIIIVGH